MKKTTKTKAAPASKPAEKFGKCQAKDVGHKSCQCGRPGCGARVNERD